MTQMDELIKVGHEDRYGKITEVSYIEDGRPCQIVEVRELRVGDEILGWYGETWTWGKVTNVERLPFPSYGGEPRVYWLIYTDDGRRSDHITNGESLRRITRRTT